MKTDYKEIYVNLDVNMDDIKDIEKRVVVSSKKEGGSDQYISLHELWTKKNDMNYLVSTYGEHSNKIKEYLDKLSVYKFYIIILENYEIDRTIETFVRINTSGRSLAIFDIVASRIYDEKFDLRGKYVKLNKELENKKYGIPPEAFLKCISIPLYGVAKNSSILKEIDSKKVQENWEELKKSIYSAIDYFTNHYNIPSIKILPYPALLVMFSYFFFKNKNKSPNKDQEKWLKWYFWRSSWNGRFSGASETAIEKDAKRIDLILENKAPNFSEAELSSEINRGTLQEIPFGTGFKVKTVLSLLCQCEPKDFDNRNIDLAKNSLTEKWKSNLHHFFPKKFLKEKGVEEKKQNLLLNMTFISSKLNQNIGSEAPSDYMSKYIDHKEKEKITESHLIEWDSWQDGYDKFIEKRSERIAKELKKRMTE